MLESNSPLNLGAIRSIFLDVTIINNNEFLEFDWYHKPTFSGRYLNFLSAHLLSHKRGTMMGMIDRCVLLSHPRHHDKNFKFIINTLMQNDYPPEFIFETINLRLKMLFNKQSQAIDNASNSLPGHERPSWFILPYIESISDKFRSITSNLNTRLTYFSLNKFRTL